MRRLCFQSSRKTLLTLAVLLAVGICWLGYSQFGGSSESQAGPAPIPGIELPAASEYALHDARVIDNGAEAVDQATTDGPGKVDTLDMHKAYCRAEQLAAQTKGKVFKTTITPHWFDGNTRFWYRNDLKNGAKEFVLVDAEKGTRTPAFDHSKLAAALSKSSGTQYQANRLPFNSIEFADGVKTVRFQAGGATWQCDLTSYECKRSDKAVPEESAEPAAAQSNVDQDDDQPWAGESHDDDEDTPQKKKGTKKKGGFLPPQARQEAKSPDGKWTAIAKNNNVFLRDKDDKETQLTENGVTGNGFASLTWSPDSQTLVAYRTEPGDNKEVYMIETSPRDQLAAKLHTRAYPRPGDKFARHEIYVIDMEARTPIKVDMERIDFRGVPRLRWSKDGRHFTLEKTDRGHQRFRVVEVEAKTGKTRNIIDEKATTFVDHYSFNFIRYLDDTSEILYVSEMDGWKHIYVIDAKEGKVKHQTTKGEYVVRAIERVDVQRRQIWFQASGKNPGQNPYFIHYYRVNFDGSGLVALTEGDGNHSRGKEGLAFSPNQKYFIDTYSRVDMPPVHELRRVSDGVLMCKLEQADVSALEATGWRAPEVFVAKARDGKTDIWGIVCRPQNYDPGKKYPVIEYIYAGPHGSFAPTTFAAYRPMAALAELGFIVVQCDGMGTAHRSRAFHDVCWQNVGDAGFPDRILWMKALAQKYAYVDITRVGIYGTSAGGQSSTGALLFHPEFYKVAVSSCGCHDNRLDKSSWNEQWMGAMGPHYEKQSNVTNAHKLQGKLLLIVGELDTNVPFESTMRVVDALIRARKDFDLIVVPGMGHSDGGQYGNRRRWDYFVRHLHGVEPPERNRNTTVAADGE